MSISTESASFSSLQGPTGLPFQFEEGSTVSSNVTLEPANNMGPLFGRKMCPESLESAPGPFLAPLATLASLLLLMRKWWCRKMKMKAHGRRNFDKPHLSPIVGCTWG